MPSLVRKAEDAIYYCFYENPGEHNAPRHDGIRTHRYTLSYIWTSGEWMLFDMNKDPMQMKNVIDDPAYKACLLYTSRCV